MFYIPPDDRYCTRLVASFGRLILSSAHQARIQGKRNSNNCLKWFEGKRQTEECGDCKKAKGIGGEKEAQDLVLELLRVVHH